MSPEDELIRAGEARQLLDNAMFKEASKRVTDSLAAQRRAVPIRDTDMHTRLIISEQLWNNMIDWLQLTADTGQFAKLEIAQREAAKRGLFNLFNRG